MEEVSDGKALPRMATVREALLQAHTFRGIDTSLNGVQFGATMRLLTSVAAVVIRHQDQRRPFNRFEDSKFEAGAIDAAIDELSKYADLFDTEHPFLQLAPDPKNPVTDPVKKLLPYMPPDRAEGFWAASGQANRLELSDAVLGLLVSYFYSFGGNNRLDGRACVNGSPGIRYVGKGYTATEIMWQGQSLFETLSHNIPNTWVGGIGLPAWADPRGTTALQDSKIAEHPLWRATWGSNTARCQWEGSQLVAASVGGSPYRPPLMGQEKHEAKAWWDLRNTQDPFYLYHRVTVNGSKGGGGSAEPKAQRLDFGYGVTQLEAEWHSKNLSGALSGHSSHRAKNAGSDTPLLFLRHLVEGSASSPVIRRSEVMVSDRSLWQVSDKRANAVAVASNRVKATMHELCKPFTRKGRLGALENRRNDVEAEFWSEVRGPFANYILNGSNDSYVDPQVWPEVLAAALRAFDTVVESVPHSKIAPKLSVARNRVSWHIAELLDIPRKA